MIHVMVADGGTAVESVLGYIMYPVDQFDERSGSTPVVLRMRDNRLRERMLIVIEELA